MRYLVWLACLISLGTPAVVHAHGAGYGIDNESRTVVLRFLYSGNLPMAYAHIRIFGPEDEETQEFQNGRTDVLGRFAFVPDRTGTWRVEANDGMGHAVFAEVDILDDPDSPLLAVSGSDVRDDCFVWKFISGISIILLSFCAVYNLLGRRRNVKK